MTSCEREHSRPSRCTERKAYPWHALLHVASGAGSLTEYREDIMSGCRWDDRRQQKASKDRK